MAKTTKPKYIAVVAEYDESGSDGLYICNAIPFTKPEKVAEFIVEDFNDIMSDAEEMGVQYEELDLERVTNKIKSLQKGESHVWKSPADMPRQINWKVFVK